MFQNESINGGNDRINGYLGLCLASERPLEYLAGLRNVSEYERAIIKARINGAAVRANDATQQPIVWKWLEENELPEFPWVCNALGLVPGPISILSGFANTGKTFFAANLAICVANGLPLFGTIPIEAPGKVLHIDWDQGQKFSHIYYRRLMNGYALRDFANIEYFRPQWHLDDDCARGELSKWLPNYKLCIIDCLGAAIPSADLNDDRVRAYIDMLNDISEQTKCAVLLLHHEPKSTGKDPLKTVKGNGSIISAAGGSIHLTKEVGGREITLTLGKKRLVKDFALQYTLDDCGAWCEKWKIESGLRLNLLTPPDEMKAATDETSLADRVLRLVQTSPGINASAIKHQIKGGNDAITGALAQLVSDDCIRVEGEKPRKHFITEQGEAILAFSEEKGQ